MNTLHDKPLCYITQCEMSYDVDINNTGKILLSFNLSLV